MRNNEWNDADCMFLIVDYLQQAISDLQRHQWNKEEFLEDYSFQGNCAFCAIQIGENVKRLSKEFREQYSDNIWKDLAGMRDVYAHAYHKFNVDSAWDSMTEDYPKILKKCLEICEENGWEVPPPPKITKPSPVEKIMSAFEELERTTDNAPEKFKALVNKVWSLKNPNKHNQNKDNGNNVGR